MAPELSVVIPTRDRCERLRACLDSLAKQTAPAASYEVLVVVDGSTDGTEEMLAQLSVPYPLRVLVQPRRGQGAAVNRATEAADASRLLLLDDDMIASPSLVAAHVDVQRATEDTVGIGHIERLLPDRADRLSRKRADDWKAHYESLAHRPPTLRDAYCGNLSLARETLRRAGGFAEDLPIEKDTELALRLHRLGVTFQYVPEAITTEDAADDWRRIIRHETARGRVAVELYRRRPAILPWIELGGRSEQGRTASLLRSLMLGLRVSPVIVARAVMLAPGRTEAALDFAHRYAYWSGVRHASGRDLWQRLRRGVPILMYHAVGAEGERPSRYVVSARRFERQMRWLARRGYTVLALDEYLRLRSEFALPLPKSVVITFDDGYRDNLELARPILEQHGFPATIFLTAAAGDRKRSGDDALAGRPLVSLDEARAALGGVISYGAHSRTHRRLPELSPAEARREVVGSKQELEVALDVPVVAFAYPYGAFDDSIKQIVEDAGFTGAVSVESGRNRPATDDYALRRLEVYGTFGLLGFMRALAVGELRLRRPGK